MRVLENESIIDLQVLCHDHHVKLTLTSLSVGDRGAPTIVYACPDPSCLVHYNSSKGYFILSGNGHGLVSDPLPAVRCKQDQMPMYLAEVLADKKNFRLWKCPKCKTVLAINP